MVSVYVLAILSTVLAGVIAFILFGADQLLAGKNEVLMKQLKEKNSDSPFMDETIADEMKDSIEPILRTWQTADKNNLPLQMDKGFRERILQTIHLLKKSGLHRELRFSNVSVEQTGKQYNFRYWDDRGREWREGVITASALERYVSTDGNVLSENLYRSIRMVIRQSRHIRNSERKQNKERKKNYQKEISTFYDKHRKQICPSCGAELTIDAQEVTCPYCDRKFFANFFDWQTEEFIFEVIPARNLLTEVLPQSLLIAALSGLSSLMMLLFLGDTIDFLTRVMLCGIGIIVGFILAFIVLAVPERIKESRCKKIVRYSEDRLRSDICDELWKNADKNQMLDLWLGKLKIKKVSHSEDMTRLTIQVPVNKTELTEEGAIQTNQNMLKAQVERARYPQRMKSKGEVITDKECPSCGAPFEPDENNCCSYCGYGLHIDNSKWKLL